MTSITMDGVSKYFDGGETVANSRLDLEVDDGEFLVILGPSGCGKTTALRLVAGLEDPSEGDIYFDDERVNRWSPSERNVAMVFQNYALYPHMSVRENIAYPLKVRGIPPDERDRRIEEVTELLHIEGQIGKRPAALSGGQRQRVALARAIVREPSVFLLDEPLSNLDAKLRQEMRSELKRLQDELGITTIYVTHNQEEAMSMADTVVVMNRGTIQQISPPEELYSRPRTEWVARFIGSPPMNLFEGRRRNGSIAIGEAGTVDLEGVAGIQGIDAASASASTSTSASLSDDLSLGIRPEDLFLSSERPTSGNALEGTVDTVEPLGEYTLVNVAVDDRLVKVKVGDADVTRGEEVWVTFDDEDAYLYDENGELVTQTASPQPTESR
nr:ABC transporter ATP-binding protein [Halobiforma lacisalsi]